VKNIHLKNVVIALSMMCLLCSCSLPDIPVVENDGTFPKFYVGTGFGSGMGAGTAISCMDGSYIGKRIDETMTYCRKGKEVPDPEGRGRIHTFYGKSAFPSSTAPNPSRHVYGYTMTVHTNEDGIITKCSATEQYLGEYR
jgi:hypothetical protein